MLKFTLKTANTGFVQREENNIRKQPENLFKSQTVFFYLLSDVCVSRIFFNAETELE